jgi:hypothetical protein
MDNTVLEDIIPIVEDKPIVKKSSKKSEEKIDFNE